MIRTGAATLVVLMALWLSARGAGAETVDCKTDLEPEGGFSSAVPTDVVADGGRVFLLYGKEGGARALDAQGNVLMELTSQSGPDTRPTAFRALSLWTGSGAPPAILATHDDPDGACWVLTPEGGRLSSLRLRGSPDPISDEAVVSRTPRERILVVDCQSDPARMYIFSASGRFEARGSLKNVGKVRRLAVDHQSNLYLLNDRGLVVMSRQGSRRYTIAEAQAFALSREDRLVAAGPKWIRKFDLAGNLLVEGRPPSGASQAEAVSLAADGSMYCYYVGDRLVKYDARGEVEEEHTPDAISSLPGYSLDPQGRLFAWDSSKEQLLLCAPSGKVLNRAAYVPGGFAPDTLVNPVDLALAPDGTVWIAEAGGCRLQRWNFQKGWLEPVAVGIRAGAPRASPLQVKCDRQGNLLMVVSPGSGQGQLVLQRRDPSGKLQGQKDLGDAAGDPVVKLAWMPEGDWFLYRADFQGRPTLEHYDLRGNRIGRVGGHDPNLSLSNVPNTGLFMKPEEDMLPYKGGVLMPTNGQLVYLDPEMKVYKQLTLKHKRGAAGGRVAADFGGACLTREGVLYLTDLANQVVHKVPLR